MHLKALEEARAAARKAVRAGDAVVRIIADAGDLPPRAARKLLGQLENALVEVKKHRALAIAYQRGLTDQTVAEPPTVQSAVVEETNAALTRLEAAGAEVRWKVARDALGRMRDIAAQAEGLSVDVLARTQARVIARLDQHMTQAKRCFASTVADEKRFQAASEDRRDPSTRLGPPPDPATVTRALAVQAAAVADLRRQLRDVNDRVELLKRNARAAAALRGR